MAESSNKKAKVTSSKSTLSSRLPIVDLKDDKDTIIKKLKEAARDLGFFQVINHGVTTSAAVLEASKEFYSQSLDEKNKHKLVYAEGTMLRGYASLGAEQADVANNSLTSEAIPDLMESFQMADPNFVDDQYPTEAMKNTLIPLYEEFSNQGKSLLDLLAQTLPNNNDQNDHHVFRKQHSSKSRTVLRVTRYPALNECSLSNEDGDRANDENSKVSRISPHRDLGTLTLLLQDNQGGLEVQDPETNEWVAVPPVEGALVINIGNLLTRWTAGYFRSSIHRVMATKGTSHSNQDRYSIIFFMNPDDEFEMEPLECCVRALPDGQQPLPGVKVGAYMACKLTQLFDPNAREEKGACRFDD